MSDDPTIKKVSPLRPLPNLIFASRWLQLPLYLGLIVAQGVYVVHFLVELLHLVEAAMGSQTALQALISSTMTSNTPVLKPMLPLLDRLTQWAVCSARRPAPV